MKFKYMYSSTWLLVTIFALLYSFIFWCHKALTSILIPFHLNYSPIFTPSFFFFSD